MNFFLSNVTWGPLPVGFCLIRDEHILCDASGSDTASRVQYMHELASDYVSACVAIKQIENMFVDVTAWSPVLLNPFPMRMYLCILFPFRYISL
jgi:hypothetical protein